MDESISIVNKICGSEFDNVEGLRNILNNKNDEINELREKVYMNNL